jgi:AcrR family transcriptional regulator
VNETEVTMQPGKGVGSRRSENLDAIMQGTLDLMLEEGYAAVTYRSVATRAGVTPGLVQYYFASLDDLFIAVLRRGTDEIVERLSELAAAQQPLRAMWDYASNRTGTALLLEFMALANHRKAIGHVIGEGGERVRRALLENLSAKWPSYGLNEGDLSPRAALFLMSSIPRMAHLEETFGTVTGHAEAFELVDRFLDGVEPHESEPVKGRRRRAGLS